MYHFSPPSCKSCNVMEKVAYYAHIRVSCTPFQCISPSWQYNTDRQRTYYCVLPTLMNMANTRGTKMKVFTTGIGNPDFLQVLFKFQTFTNVKDTDTTLTITVHTNRFFGEPAFFTILTQSLDLSRYRGVSRVSRVVSMTSSVS